MSRCTSASSPTSSSTAIAARKGIELTALIRTSFRMAVLAVWQRGRFPISFVKNYLTVSIIAKAAVSARK
jgi:hypothetical protein